MEVICKLLAIVAQSAKARTSHNMADVLRGEQSRTRRSLDACHSDWGGGSGSTGAGTRAAAKGSLFPSEGNSLAGRQ